jgi:drug/metabolite transporter (DMT)-like permease
VTVIDRKRYVTDLLMLSVVLIWGCNFSVMKIAYRSFHPISFNAVRFVIASLIIAFVMKRRGPIFRIDRRDAWRIIWLGFLVNTLYQFLFVLGLERTKAGNAALLLALVPVFAFLIGVFTKRAKFSLGVLAGIVLSLGGVAAIVAFGSAGLSLAGTWRGDLMMLGAAFVWGWYTASSIDLLEKYGPLHLTAITMIAGTVFLLPPSIPWLFSQNWRAIESAAWLALIYAGALSIVYCYCVWAYALSTIGATHTAMFANVTPIIALLGGWLLLGEQPTVAQITGVVLVLTGVFLVRSWEEHPVSFRALP